MDGCEQQSGDECEVVDEEAELGLVRGPVRWAVECKAEKQHVGSCRDRGFPEVESGQERDYQTDFEKGGDPGQRKRGREAGGGDKCRRCRHADELERRRHGEDSGKDQPGDEDCDGLRHGSQSYSPPTSANSAPCGSVPMMIQSPVGTWCGPM